jgi:hypothetical protein
MINAFECKQSALRLDLSDAKAASAHLQTAPLFVKAIKAAVGIYVNRQHP